MSLTEFIFVMMVVLPITVLWIGCVIDIISRPDLTGWGKAAWLVGVLILPLLGSLIYVVVRPRIIVSNGPSVLDEAWSTPRPEPQEP